MKLLLVLAQKKMPNHIKKSFFYYNEKINYKISSKLFRFPVATTMSVYNQDVVAVHWLGTLPEYRRRGIGYAITHKSLLDAYKQRCREAVLFGSVLGKSVYERIGFRVYAIYNTYGLD